jgi:hypothetical protein
MVNAHRGEVPFRALGRDLFLVYRTQELGAMQTALGFCRPGTFVKPTTEQVPALNLKKKNGKVVQPLQQVQDDDGQLLAALDKHGKPKMRTVIVTPHEQHRREIEAFDAIMLKPAARELPTLIRCGLACWERENEKLTDAQFDELLEEVGFFELAALHQQALEHCYRTGLPEEETLPEGDDPNGKSPATASQT